LEKRNAQNLWRKPGGVFLLLCTGASEHSFSHPTISSYTVCAATVALRTLSQSRALVLLGVSRPLNYKDSCPVRAGHSTAACLVRAGNQKERFGRTSADACNGTTLCKVVLQCQERLRVTTGACVLCRLGVDSCLWLLARTNVCLSVRTTALLGIVAAHDRGNPRFMLLLRCSGAGVTTSQFRYDCGDLNTCTLSITLCHIQPSFRGLPVLPVHASQRPTETSECIFRGTYICMHRDLARPGFALRPSALCCHG